MNTQKRYFEIAINGNIAFPAYTLEVKNEKIAIKLAVKEAKRENNSTINITEVDSNGNLIDGFCSGTIFINK